MRQSGHAAGKVARVHGKGTDWASKKRSRIRARARVY
jgi:hypothetical protein